MHGPVALVTLLALLLYAWMIMRVSSARGRLGVEAPSVTGDPEFERHYRVQANTLESLVIFLPSLWLFALFLRSDLIAEGRHIGFGIQALAQVALLLGALGGVIWRLLQGPI